MSSVLALLDQLKGAVLWNRGIDRVVRMYLV